MRDFTVGRLRKALAASPGAAAWVAWARDRLAGPFARRFAALSVLTAAGQFVFVAALPILSRMYSPADFGVFAVYLSVVNLAGPLLSLRFESALYAAHSREAAARTLLLALGVVGAMGALSCVGVWAFRDAIERAGGADGRVLIYVLPIGMVLAGAWSVSSAWAVRVEATSTLGVARFVQPALMTVLQIAAGVASPTGTGLVCSHLLSHVAYSTIIALREVTAGDLAVMRAAGLREIVELGARNRKFPLLSLPAQISTLSVSNLPPLLLSWFYGADLAGHYGVAYRLVLAPLTIASMPLGAVFTGSLVRLGGDKERGALVRRVFLLNLALVGAPVLALGVLIGPAAALILGPNWALTGQIIVALSFLGGAQALAAPFSEATSVIAAQGLRLLIDGAAATFVVGAVIAGGTAGMGALSVIWLMSLGGALLSLTGLALVIHRIDHRPRAGFPSALEPTG